MYFNFELFLNNPTIWLQYTGRENAPIPYEAPTLEYFDSSYLLCMYMYLKQFYFLFS